MRTRLGRAPDAAQERATGCKLLFVTSEISDFLKVGGLGEVSASLPRALRRVSDTRVLLPGYRAVLAANPAMRIAARPGRDPVLRDRRDHHARRSHRVHRRRGGSVRPRRQCLSR